MGRIRQGLIKRIASRVVEQYKDMLSLDFNQNREVVERVVRVEGKFMKNRIAGYVTRLMRQGGRNEV